MPTIIDNIIINKIYSHWDSYTGSDVDFYWSSYGKYLSSSEETNGKIILNFMRIMLILIRNPA